MQALRATLLFLIVATYGGCLAANESTCVSPDLAAVSGLVPGMQMTAVNSMAGVISVETDTGIDDGGTYTVYIYHYNDYRINVVRDTIDVIRITSPDYLWAGKIQLGSDKTLVMQHLVAKPVVDEEDSSQHVICSDAGDVYAILRYRDNRVIEIQLVMDRP